MAKIINVLGFKGGIGKSTTVCNLAYGLAQKGMKVLVVDTDPQSNTTSIFPESRKCGKLKNSAAEDFLQIYQEKSDSLPDIDNIELGIAALMQTLNKIDEEGNLYHLLSLQRFSYSDVWDCIHETKYENVWIIPGSQEMDTIDRNFNLKRLSVFKTIFELIDDDFDYILIDNQPIQNMVSFSTIISCTDEHDTILVLAKFDRGGIEGVVETLDKVTRLKKQSHSSAKIKILVTMENRNKNDRSWKEAFSKAFKDQMLHTTIRYQAKPITDANLAGGVLLENRSSVADDYRNLIDEILEKEE
jgi:chromosome partitioning protein